MSAPTGSGKTISYVVPIVEVSFPPVLRHQQPCPVKRNFRSSQHRPEQTLQHRIVTRLRALVLLPTRDLVGQVRETFEAFIKGTGLKVSPRARMTVEKRSSSSIGSTGRHCDRTALVCA